MFANSCVCLWRQEFIAHVKQRDPGHVHHLQQDAVVKVNWIMRKVCTCLRMFACVRGLCVSVTYCVRGIYRMQVGLENHLVEFAWS